MNLFTLRVWCALPALLLSTLNLSAQAKAPAPKPSAEEARHQRVYTQAMKRGDYFGASNALLYWMDAAPSRTDLLDSLTLCYVNSNRIPQAIETGREVIRKKPDNYPMREVMAQCYESAGRLSEARAEYAFLYDKLKKTIFLYKIATLLYYMKDAANCQLTLAMLESQPAASEEKVVLTYDDGTNSSQSVSVLAASLNMRGAILLEAGKNAEAAVLFEQALQAEPEFRIARQNLEKSRK